MKRLLISALAVAALATGAARAGTAYTDPVGDQLNSPSLVAPDITAVEVSNTPEGLVTFVITIAGSQPLPRFSGVAIALDLDRDPSTGDEGAEAFIGYIVDLLGAGQLAFDRWDGSELVEVEQTTATARFADGVVTITVPRAELLGTGGFAFAVVSLLTNLSEVALDIAPNEGVWTYDLGLPPAPPPTLAAAKPSGAPAKPRAGKPFVVSSVVTRSDTGAVVSDGSVACAVRVGSARVRAAGRFRNERAQCAITVPKTAKGKVVRGTMTIRSLESSVVRSFSFRVT